MKESDEFEIEQGNPIFDELLYVEEMIVFMESGVELTESKLKDMGYGIDVIRILKKDENYE